MALPSWKPPLRQLPAPRGNQPARMQGSAHSTPTPSPRLCPGLPRPEPWSALGVRLILPSGADGLGGADGRREDKGASLQGPPPRPEQEPWGTRVRVRCRPAGREGAVGCGGSRELHSSRGGSDFAGWTRNSQRTRMSRGPGWGTGVNQCGQKKTAQPTLRLVDWQVCLWGLRSGRGRLFMTTATTPRRLLPESAVY